MSFRTLCLLWHLRNDVELSKDKESYYRVPIKHEDSLYRPITQESLWVHLADPALFLNPVWDSKFVWDRVLSSGVKMNYRIRTDQGEGMFRKSKERKWWVEQDHSTQLGYAYSGKTWTTPSSFARCRPYYSQKKLHFQNNSLLLLWSRTQSNPAKQRGSDLEKWRFKIRMRNWVWITTDPSEEELHKVEKKIGSQQHRLAGPSQ